jgi:hypothetical protein
LEKYLFSYIAPISQTVDFWTKIQLPKYRLIGEYIQYIAGGVRPKIVHFMSQAWKLVWWFYTLSWLKKTVSHLNFGVWSKMAAIFKMAANFAYLHEIYHLLLKIWANEAYEFSNLSVRKHLLYSEHLSFQNGGQIKWPPISCMDKYSFYSIWNVW